MFKWKVSGLGGGSKKTKNGSPEVAAKLNNGQTSNEQDKKSSKNNSSQNGNSSKAKQKDKDGNEVGSGSASTSTSPHPTQKGFRLFSGSGNQNSGTNQNAANHGQVSQPTNGQTTNGILKNFDKDTMSRVGQRLAMPIIPAPAFSPNNNNNNNSSTSNNNNCNNNVDRLRLNLSTEQIFTGNDNHNTSMPNGLSSSMQPQNQPPPVPPSKPGWRPPNAEEDEEAIPNDSLYGHQDSKKNGSLSWRDKQFGSRPSLNGMAHWSSHGYLAKASDGTLPATSDPDPTGYVVLKRQGEHIVTMRQPQSLPNQVPLPTPVQPQDGDRKYFSVKGFTDMNSKHSQETEAKYLSVDARYNSMKNLPPDIRMKLRENLRQVHEKQQLQQQQHQQQQQQQQRNFTPYQAPPPPPSYPFPPAPPPRPAGMKPAPPPRQESVAVPAQPVQPAISKSSSNLEASKQMSNSVSWLEWTQQLQAYIAWVNSQLRKRADLRPVTDLRTDLQSGEVLAQLIEIISGEKIAGIEYSPESLQGMRDNLDRILQFMAGKRIRMHHITSKEILEGNLKAVMRLILALAAHYKPQSVRHHDASNENLENKPQQPQQQQQQQQQQQPQVPSKDSSQSTKVEGNSEVHKSLNLSTATKENKPSEIGSPLNRTQDSIRSVSSMTTQSMIKRSPSMNENHYSPVSNIRTKVVEQKDSDHIETVYENLANNKKTSSATMTYSTEKNAISTQTESAPNNKPVLQKEGSFVRTGSGRKLPKIPDRTKTQTLPTGSSLRMNEEDDDDYENGDKSDHRKSRPKALEFWETLETVDSADFRYNTIHRMSMGRRMLPKPPPSDSHSSHARSLSLDRNYHDGKESLNSSFSENEKMRKDSEQGSVPPSPRPGVHKKIPPDGCSLQSSSSSGGAQPGQPSPPSSSDTRGEVEGSSDNNSPPTSVIQGTDPNSDPWDNVKSRTSNPAFDWIRGAYGSKSSTNQMFRSLEEEVAYLRAQRIGDGNSSGKLSDSDCGNIPYEVLIQDLTQAKRQLLELHSLECANLQGSKLGLESRLAEQETNLGQLKQDLLRTTLAKQTLEFEKKELLRRIEELERGCATIKSENVEKDKLIRTHKMQMEEFSRRNKEVALVGNTDSELRAMYEEELAVAKDAISNLRTSFRDADPSQHILDTLEQCISVIIEKIQRLDQDKANNSRMSSLEYNRVNDGHSVSSQPSMTKILYFTNRSVTPFMSTIYKKIGDITLRDFKNLFDRPGFYRFHFKTVDQEFGMVKEEISNDDAVLPGSDGKVVAWVEED